MLQDLVNKTVFVRLKWGQVEYKGTLVSVDSYMNLQLSGTEEYVSNKPAGLLGQVLIRYVTSTLSPSMSIHPLADQMQVQQCPLGARSRRGERRRHVRVDMNSGVVF